MQHNAPRTAKTRTVALARQKKANRIMMTALSAVVLLTTLFWSQSLWAADNKAPINEDPALQKQAASFIQTLADRALTSLGTAEFSLADQEVRFREILTDGFDVNYIGRISLGRHKKAASNAQVTAYQSLFPEYLVKVYTSRLTKLDTQEVRTGDVLPKGKIDMYVRTKVINADGKSYDVDWRVRPTPNADNSGTYDFKIIDVKIEGISMARTQRDDFTARITESGMTGLIAFMQAIVDGTATPQTAKVETEATTN
ncbi:ABC transporter substrate-binding protein [Paremcibacter congregatus]|uniref:MlaC/ttg2D family ABC transporter substrate-binding protein n=1 Tax=Paremcibacter congregatus TaxID=2043170 RepID=UPI0030EEB7BE|tara:strand:- start:17320 stop:18087 length:768 start_codon:yes stop_codon:yes gene_type:complete